MPLNVKDSSIDFILYNALIDIWETAFAFLSSLAN